MYSSAPTKSAPDLMERSVNSGRRPRPEGADAESEKRTVTFDVAKAVRDVKAGKDRVPRGQGVEHPRPRWKDVVRRGKSFSRTSRCSCRASPRKALVGQGSVPQEPDSFATMGVDRAHTQQVINAVK